MKNKRTKIIIEGTIGNIDLEYFMGLYGKDIKDLEITVNGCEILPLKKIKFTIVSSTGAIVKECKKCGFLNIVKVVK